MVVTTPAAAVQTTPWSPILGLDYANQNPSSAGRVLPVQAKESSVMEGAHITTALVQNVFLEFARHLHIEKMPEPPVHNWPWTRKRMNAVDNVRTSRPMLELARAA